MTPSLIKRKRSYDRQGSEREKYRQALERIHALLVTEYPDVEVVWGGFRHGDVHFERRAMELRLVPESAFPVDATELPFLSFVDVPRDVALRPHEVLGPPDQNR